MRSTSVSPWWAFRSQPSVGRSALHPRVDERRERALRILLADEEVDVVLGRRSAARPRREPAPEQVRDLGVAQRGGRDLHGVDQVGEVVGRRVGHDDAGTRSAVCKASRPW